VSIFQDTFAPGLAPLWPSLHRYAALFKLGQQLRLFYVFITVLCIGLAIVPSPKVPFGSCYCVGFGYKLLLLPFQGCERQRDDLKGRIFTISFYLISFLIMAVFNAG
jgi:hypothetical protein